MTSTEVKMSAIVDSNFDTAYLDQYILYCQRRYIRPFLGEDYYEELLTQIAGSSLTSDNNTLLESYIKPSLAHYVVHASLPQLRNQIAKGGVWLNLSDTSDAASNVGYNQIRDDYITKAEAFREEIDYFIKDARKDDSTKYPLYCGKNSQDTGIVIY